MGSLDGNDEQPARRSFGGPPGIAARLLTRLASQVLNLSWQPVGQLLLT